MMPRAPSAQREGEGIALTASWSVQRKFRGYEKIDEKLLSLGAKIQRIEE